MSLLWLRRSVLSLGVSRRRVHTLSRTHTRTTHTHARTHTHTSEPVVAEPQRPQFGRVPEQRLGQAPDVVRGEVQRLQVIQALQPAPEVSLCF